MKAIEPPYLTDDEIKDITKPLKQPAAICRWFRNNGFDCSKIRPNGLPLIPRAQYFGQPANDPPNPANSGGITLDFRAYRQKYGRKSG